MEVYTQYLVTVEILWTTMERELLPIPTNVPISVLFHRRYKHEMQTLVNRLYDSRIFADPNLSENEMRKRSREFNDKHGSATLPMEENSVYGVMLKISLVFDVVSELVHGMGG